MECITILETVLDSSYILIQSKISMNYFDLGEREIETAKREEEDIMTNPR